MAAVSMCVVYIEHTTLWRWSNILEEHMYIYDALWLFWLKERMQRVTRQQ